eukprot:CAMPEP_0116011384 /NCGR_PEP_ID=MMETSP0321-20121206/4537_1 /TAXON_ID=163516 /ORGANISM="Leptocylindrus danicus var. danicus, Strain B650" /LENGTH=222 /DNA_ID=CAMNT_0003480609 /DNA_START=135 /DNA_END=803 /DNA_ORIENTATION=+
MGTAALLMSAFGTGGCRFAKAEFDSTYTVPGTVDFPEITSAEFGLWEFSDLTGKCKVYTQDQLDKIADDSAWRGARGLKVAADCFGIIAFVYLWLACLFPIRGMDKCWRPILATCFFFAFVLNAAAFSFFDNQVCGTTGVTCRLAQDSRLAIAGTIFYFITMFLACKVPEFRKTSAEKEDDIAAGKTVGEPVVAHTGSGDQGTIATHDTQGTPASPGTAAEA